MLRCLMPGLLLAISAAILTKTISAETLKQEPAAGSMRPGETVLVDDGSCPAGQIKQVSGGNRSAGQLRERKCVERTGSTNPEPAIERYAVGGKRSEFAYYFSLKLDCTPQWQEVKMTKAPDSGKAVLQESAILSYYSPGNARERCNGKSVKAITLEYTPAKGYTGKDSIVVEKTNEAGESNIFRYDIMFSWICSRRLILQMRLQHLSALPLAGRRLYSASTIA